MINNEVYYKGVLALRLNQSLISKQDLSQEQVNIIRNLHYERLLIEEFMSNTEDPVELHRLFDVWTDNQYDLQGAWGFEKDVKFHIFWYVPHCSCPKLDNDDAYPTGYYTVNCDCPVHGELK